MEKAREVATLAAGCFWCVEAVFGRLKGVEQVISGYTGGTTGRASYEEVCSGTTGHAEAVQIVFDPEVITFRQLLEVFWRVHDPTTLDRQGADEGTQYRSAIFYHDETQRQTAEKSLRSVEAARIWPRALVTEIVPMKAFHPAEEYHQHYFDNHREQPYCRIVIQPKLRKLLEEYPQLVTS